MNPSNNCPHGIIYLMDDCAGFTRRKCGKGFIYIDCEGQKIKDPEILQRIKELVIPPMWENVWICQKPNGHLQVTGFDLKSRKQYIYHPKWVAHRQLNKYSQLLEFGKKLPLIRKKIEEDIQRRGWPKEKILAMIVMMLDEYYIRIGNKQYEQENQTYGLTTLRRKHIVEKDGKLYLQYKAKSGKERRVKVESKRLIRMIKKISELPGYEIFKYIEKDKTKHRLDSHDVNEYLCEISGHYFTAKDFRTWGGTMLAIENFPHASALVEGNPRKKLEPTLVKLVAKTLGNTLAVCREYYIHPKVMQVLLDDKLDSYADKPLKNIKYVSQLSKSEKLLMKIISE
ncbi:DNA topoisomerase I [Echinicola pacifica]|uniref:DNA topoisomerase n=1 Tax=Echinicola pacifica TaxID=346377 RepID=A0A918ULF2_9BACT|nr:DNA topoisomerase IB [Echinicola pacifica]GGZ18435.1 DNA topoisomerase I [Echinicola pacifica]